MRLPILGYFSEKQAILAYSEPNAFLNVAPSLVEGKKRAFVLQVKENLLADDGILDGDLLVLEEEPKVNNADLVIAILEDNSAVLKRFFKEETRVRLESIKAKKAPIYTSRVRIQGRVIALVRNY